ncbi:hypothetical protein M679_07990, partial [Neisseria gonorrhoeae SK7842]
NKNQDKATKPQTVQIVRQGEATRYRFKFNPLYCRLILWVSKPGGAETLQKCRLKLEIGFRRHWFTRQVGA